MSSNVDIQLFAVFSVVQSLSHVHLLSSLIKLTIKITTAFMRMYPILHALSLIKTILKYAI